MIAGPDAPIASPAHGRTKALLLSAVVAFSAWSWLSHGGLARANFDVDTFDYAQMARQVYRGEGFTMQQTFPYVLRYLDQHGIPTDAPWPNTTRFPLIAVEEAAAFAVTGVNDRGILAAGGAMFVATAAIAFLLANRLFGAWAGLAAAVMTAMEPAQLHYSRSGLLETGAGFFTVLAALALVAATQPGRHRGAAAAALGVSLGLGFLQRYDLLALAPVAVVLLATHHDGAREDGLRTRLLVCCAAGFAIAAGPWITRNLATIGTLLGSTSIDRNLLGGIVPGDVYLATETVSPWRVALENWTGLLGKLEVACAWFAANASGLFGGSAAMGAAAGAFVVVPLIGSRAARTTWMFLLGGFAARALLLSLMHNEPRFYLSFAPLVIVLGAGSVAAAVGLLPARARTAALAVLTIPLAVHAWSVPKTLPATIDTQPPAEFVALRDWIPPGALVASDVSWMMAWYVDRPSVRFHGDWQELLAVEKLGVRAGAVLLTPPAARSFTDTGARELEKSFSRVPAVPAGYALWLRRPG